MAKKSPDGPLSDFLGPTRALVEQNKKIFVEKHEYRPAGDVDFEGRDRAWYDEITRQLRKLGFAVLTDVVNATVEKAANVRAVIRRLVSKDGTTMAAVYQFLHGRSDLRVCEFESELSDATFLATSNAEASRGVSLPPQIVCTKQPAATTVPELLKLHQAAQKKLRKAKRGATFVAIRTADDYQAAQHRQEAIKAAFRAGFNYLDPAEVRRIAEQKAPDDPAGAAIAAVVADIARRPPTLLETMMNATDGDAGPGALDAAFAEHLTAGKAALPAEARGDIADAVTNLFQSAESGDAGAGFKGLLALMGKLDGLEPAEEKAARGEKARLNRERMVADQKKWEARHRRKRLDKGLIETAGTGHAESAVPMYALPISPLAIDDAPRSLTGHVKAVEAAKRSRDDTTLAGLPTGASRLGGVPDLPPGVEWPAKSGKRLPFIAQVDLSKFKAKQTGLLPARGHLFVFALISNEKKHRPAPVSVFIHNGPSKSLVRATLDDDAKIWPDWTGENVYELLPVTDRPRRKKDDDDAGRKLAYLGGKMDGGFGTAGEIADAALLDGDDWINLLAVHSVGSMQWSDSGHLYLLIRRGDLKRRDFSNVYAAVCSS